MTQPLAYGGRPLMPAPGASAPELRVARVRGHARRLTWSAIVLIAVAGAVGYFYGNLPAPLENWMLLAAAALVVLLLVLVPFLVWWSHTYTITTRRVLSRNGLFTARRRELTHVRGYTIEVRRSIAQRMWRTGTLTLSDGVGEPMQLVDIPDVELLHEVLVDQVEVSQILAHRDAQPPLPPQAPPPP